jgi:DNA polymerase-3 subunit alpha
VKARVSRSDDRLSLHAQSVVVPDLSGPSSKGPMQVTMAAARCTPPVVARLCDVLQAHPGTTAVHIRLTGGSSDKKLQVDDRFRVTMSSALMGDLKALLGADCLA